MRVPLLLAVALLAALFPRTAAAANYYVATSGGNDSNNCATAQTVGTPKATITSGLTCLASGGDTLFIRTGTYNEGINLNTVAFGSILTGYVRIANYNGETVWVAPDAAHAVKSIWIVYGGNDTGEANSAPSYIEIDGINLDGAAHDGVAIGILDTRGPLEEGGDFPHHIRFQNLWMKGAAIGQIEQNSAHFLTGGSSHHIEFLDLEITGTGGPYGIYIAGDDSLVDGCNIHGTASLGVHIYGNTGVFGGHAPERNIVRNTRIHDINEAKFFLDYDGRIGGILATGTDHQIYNNLIYDIHLTGQGTPDPYGGILTFSTSPNPKIYNNTIVNVDGYGIRVTAGATDAVVRNNILYQNDTDAIEDSGASTTADHNLLGTNPTFTNSAADDYTLLTGSPAINAGADLSGTFTTDFLNTTRPEGAAWDIGAYEFSSVSVSCVAIAPVIACGGSGADDSDSAVSDAVDTSGAELLVMTVSWYPGEGGTCVPSDSKGNTWTGLDESASIFNYAKARIFYVNSVTPTVGASHVFRCDGARSYPIITFVAVNGASASPFDHQGGSIDSVVATLAVGPLTPTRNDALIVAALSLAGPQVTSEDVAINGGFTTAFFGDFLPGVEVGGGGAFLVQTMIGVHTPAFSWITDSYAAAAIASFHLSADVTVTDPRIRIRTR